MKPYPRSNPTVLIVHENCRLNEFLRSSLSNAGFRVVAADSGLGAVALASSHSLDSVDVLLAQSNPSVMSGLNLARWMHQTHPQLKYLELADAAPPGEAFPTGCVPLPLEREKLVSGVRKLLGPQFSAA
jgi:CheY-like chemotaxis protein